MKTTQRISDYVVSLSKRENSETVFNPYRSKALANNLEIYLNYIFFQPGEKILLIGEAPGYKGCRLTGIPFSSGALIKAKQHKIFYDISDDVVLKKVELENSASAVWESLVDVKHYPLFWNAFPFHPHPKGNNNKNRAPNKKEMTEGEGYLSALADIFSPTIVAGIGRKGESAGKQVFPEGDVVYIRHPSYGGKKEFVAGMERVLGSS